MKTSESLKKIPSNSPSSKPPAFAKLLIRPVSSLFLKVAGIVTSSLVLIRFFQKSFGHYQSRRVHESISITGNVKSTSASILHFENLTLSQRFEKANRYSELKAEDKLERGDIAYSIVSMLIFPVSFIQFFIFKGHFLGGINGFITSMNAAFYNFMKYSKLRELRKIKNL